MASIWNSPWDTNNDWYNKMLASGQYWNDWDLAHASQDQNFANTIFQAKSDYANATTDEGRALANANAEAARKNYNYTSGSAGAEYNPFGNGVTSPGGGSSFWGGEMMSAYNNVKNQPSFSYTPYQAPAAFSFADFQAPAPFSYEEFQAPDPFQYEKYENTTPDFQHSDAYNKTMADALGYGDFSYDYTTDPLYDVYKKEYTREGRRASEDALAQAAAMTGGVPSSYANTAAQQAGNYYASQIADKIPELRQQAYNEYQNKYNQLLSKHNVANAGDQFDYGIYKDKLNQDYQQYLDDLQMRYGMYRDNYNDLWNQYNTNRNFAYNQYSDDYARDWDRYVNNRNFAYNQYADDRNFGYNQWLDQTNLDRAINQDNYNRAMDLYGLAGNNYWQMHGEDLDAAAAEDAKKLDYAKLLYGLGDPSALADYYGDDGRLLAALAEDNAPTGGYRGYVPPDDDDDDNTPTERIRHSDGEVVNEDGTRFVMPGQMSSAADDLLKNAQMAGWFRNGVFSSSGKKQLSDAYTRGIVTEEELNTILDLLGVPRES